MERERAEEAGEMTLDDSIKNSLKSVTSIVEDTNAMPFVLELSKTNHELCMLTSIAKRSRCRPSKLTDERVELLIENIEESVMWINVGPGVMNRTELATVE